MIILGGSSREKCFNDFWILTINNSINLAFKWKNLKINDNCSTITPRFGSTMVFTNNKIYIHGGQDLNQNFYADLFEVEIIKNKENEYDSVNFIKNHVLYPLSLNKYPSERNSHCSYLSDNDLLLFGGGNSSGLIDDMWIFSNNEFNKIKGNYTGLEMTGITLFKSKIYIFGGREIEKISDKIRIYNYDKENLCTSLSDTIQMPFSISSYAYCTHKEFFIIYGGIENDKFSTHIKVYNMESSKWYFYNKQINIEASICPIMVNDDQIIIIFGGSSIQSESNQLTILNINDIINESNLIDISLIK